jgi:hypothetical protein
MRGHRAPAQLGADRLARLGGRIDQLPDQLREAPGVTWSEPQFEW